MLETWCCCCNRYSAAQISREVVLNHRKRYNYALSSRCTSLWIPCHREINDHIRYTASHCRSRHDVTETIRCVVWKLRCGCATNSSVPGLHKLHLYICITECPPGCHARMSCSNNENIDFSMRVVHTVRYSFTWWYTFPPCGKLGYFSDMRLARNENHVLLTNVKTQRT